MPSYKNIFHVDRGRCPRKIFPNLFVCNDNTLFFYNKHSFSKVRSFSAATQFFWGHKRGCRTLISYRNYNKIRRSPRRQTFGQFGGISVIKPCKLFDLWRLVVHRHQNSKNIHNENLTFFVFSIFGFVLCTPANNRKQCFKNNSRNCCKSLSSRLRI